MNNIMIKEKFELQDFIQMENIEKQYYSTDFITPSKESYLWYLHNPKTLFAVQDKERIAGFLNMLPIRKQVYHSIFRGNFNDKNLTFKDILSEDELHKSINQPVYYFLSCIAVDLSYRRTHTVYLLLKKCSQYLQTLVSKGVVISGIVTDNITVAGIRFSDKLGFKYITESDHHSSIYGGTYDDFNRKITELLKNHPC